MYKDSRQKDEIDFACHEHGRTGRERALYDIMQNTQLRLDNWPRTKTVILR